MAWFAIAAQIVFIAAWIVAGALTPRYSHFASDVSTLAAHGMRYAWITVAGFVVVGAGIAALAPGLRATLPTRRASTIAIALFALAGAAIVVWGLARVDCDLSRAACKGQFDAGVLSWHTSLHVWAGLVMRVTLLLTPFALARALWPGPVAALSLKAGVIGLAISVAALVVYGVGTATGLVERIELGSMHLWVVIIAIGLLHETRSAPKLSAPAALRPRDFFGSPWSGKGAALGVPAFLWRPIAPRFTLTRETTWHSDELALVRDRAMLPNGRVEERLRYARFVDASHIHVTSDDMPDGADVIIDEQGYRIAPYRVLCPVGPVRFMLRARDEARVEPDGTLLYVVRLSWHGIPVARLEMSARPVDTVAPPSHSPIAVTRSS